MAVFDYNKLHLSYILSLISLALSPLYLWKSGLPQVAHIIMALAMALHFIIGKVVWERWWSWAGLFVVYAAIVNLTVYTKYTDPHSAISASYYIFNFFVWLHLIDLALRKDMNRFLRTIELIMWILLGGELALVVTGFGRMYGSSRSMGTFNDPNQMAHFILWLVICLGAIGWVLHRSWKYGIFAWCMGTIATAYSASRSGALGLLFVGLIYVLMGLKKGSAIILGKLNLGQKDILFTIFALILFLSFIAILYYGKIEPSVDGLTKQFSYWISRFQDSSRNTSLEGRGYDRLWKFPEYLIFGAGEGANERWAERTWFLGEIHSTLAGVIFYYGLPGILFFSFFLYNLWVRLGDLWMKLLFLAPLFYSVGTYNLRNWFFWIGLSILYITSRHQRYKLIDQKHEITK